MRASLIIWWERSRGTQKKDDCIQSSLNSTLIPPISSSWQLIDEQWYNVWVPSWETACYSLLFKALWDKLGRGGGLEDRGGHRTLANRSNAKHRSNIRAPPDVRIQSVGICVARRGRTWFIASWGQDVTYLSMHPMPPLRVRGSKVEGTILPTSGEGGPPLIPEPGAGRRATKYHIFMLQLPPPPSSLSPPGNKLLGQKMTWKLREILKILAGQPSDKYCLIYVKVLWCDI